MADQTEIATVLPKELRLGVPPKMPQGRSYLYRQQSTLASYQYNNTVTINIPRLQRSYLRKDSYLRFRVTGSWTPTTATDSLVLDTCGAYGFFDRIEVFDYLGSTILESISGIPQLSALLLDLGLDEYVEDTNGNSMAGLQTKSALIGSMAQIGGPVTLAQSKWTSGGTIAPANSGCEIVSTPGSTSAQLFSREFAIYLPSFLGLLSDKYVPLHNGFTIVLTTSGQKIPFYVSQNGALASINVYGGAATSPTSTVLINASAVEPTIKWALSEIYLDCQILELGALADSMMMEASQGAPMIVHTKAFRNYVGTVKGATYSSVTPTIVAGAFTGTAGATFTLNVAGNAKTVTVATGAAPTAASLNTAILNAFGYQAVTVATTTFTSAANVPFSITPSDAANAAYLGLTAGTTSSTAPTLSGTGQAEFVLNMNLNVASLTDVLWIMRSSTQLDSLLYACTGNRTRNFLQRWMFQYGSATLPQSNGIQAMSPTAPTQIGSDTITPSRSVQYAFMQSGSTESYQELMKSRPVRLCASRITEPSYSYDFKFNGILDMRDASQNISVTNLTGIYPMTNSTFPIGRFACGLNLQLANNKEGQIISGLNTNGMNTSIRGIFHPLYTDCMDSVRVDAWAEYDAFINISPGIATTVSF
jgi:hypothetical protein